MVEGGAGLDPVYQGASSIGSFVAEIRKWTTQAVQPSYVNVHMNANMGGGTWRIGRWQVRTPLRASRAAPRLCRDLPCVLAWCAALTRCSGARRGWQNIVSGGETMRLMTDFRRMRFGLGVVRAASRPIPPQWGSLRFRPLTCTYAPWGVRVDELAKSRKITHPKHFIALGGEQGLLTDGYYGYDVGSEMYGAPSFYTEYEAGLGQAVSDPARLAVDGAQEVI